MKYEIQENCLTVYLPGDLDHHLAEEIKRETDHLMEQHHIRHIIFDFKETEFMDSSGIGIILGRYRKLSLLGGGVWGAHVNDRIKKILQMSGVTKIMEIFEEE